MSAGGTRSTWASRWWARLLGVLVTIAFVLPAATGRACPTMQAESCCCCEHDDAQAPEAPAVKRVPCCASDMSQAPTPVAVVEQLEPPPAVAIAPEKPRAASIVPPRLRALLARPRARGPPGPAALYKQHCSFLL